MNMTVYFFFFLTKVGYKFYSSSHRLNWETLGYIQGHKEKYKISWSKDIEIIQSPFS